MLVRERGAIFHEHCHARSEQWLCYLPSCHWRLNMPPSDRLPTYQLSARDEGANLHKHCHTLWAIALLVVPSLYLCVNLPLSDCLWAYQLLVHEQGSDLSQHRHAGSNHTLLASPVSIESKPSIIGRRTGCPIPTSTCRCTLRTIVLFAVPSFHSSLCLPLSDCWSINSRG